MQENLHPFSFITPLKQCHFVPADRFLFKNLVAFNIKYTEEAADWVGDNLLCLWLLYLKFQI